MLNRFLRQSKPANRLRKAPSSQTPFGWKPVRFTLETLEDRTVPDGRPLPLPFIFVGSDAGSVPLVRAYHAETGE